MNHRRMSTHPHYLLLWFTDLCLHTHTTCCCDSQKYVYVPRLPVVVSRFVVLNGISLVVIGTLVGVVVVCVPTGFWLQLSPIQQPPTRLKSRLPKGWLLACSSSWHLYDRKCNLFCNKYDSKLSLELVSVHAQYFLYISLTIRPFCLICAYSWSDNLFPWNAYKE